MDRSKRQMLMREWLKIILQTRINFDGTLIGQVGDSLLRSLKKLLAGLGG